MKNDIELQHGMCYIIIIKKVENMRKQITSNQICVITSKIDEEAKTLHLSRNSLIETILTTNLLSSKISFSSDELDTLIHDFHTRSDNKITREFLNMFEKLPLNTKLEAVKFFYNLNLMPQIMYSCKKQANFYKRDTKEFLFYYGVLNMKEIDIDEFVSSLKIDVKTLGKVAPSNEYIFIGRMQQFKHQSVFSSQFYNICEKLGISNCDCIKIHYSKIDKLLCVLKGM